MTPLIIDETNATPKVVFDVKNNSFEISGCSRPEDVREFYHPILEWLTQFSDSIDDKLREKYSNDPLTFIFTFDYFNSSSAKFILDILLLINQIHQAGTSCQIEWRYAENDEDMKEVGEELSEVVDFPFLYKEVFS